ncbi:hypothetical protein Cycma_2643 [Cyclobacterium marinum DSM 745]|uniref:Uncharacterized protein n=1 Tax=Cyclobacterium marinum (strain ATCC 25205 / DSM 745 / LMG 13164 / NCIMB 1802) TaxID=880070 RepID=G0IXF7_CYCMS|nr:hypothetical protein Cycma_2643 [Cyclobacterium marinum DSM 745]
MLPRGFLGRLRHIRRNWRLFDWNFMAKFIEYTAIIEGHMYFIAENW